MRQGSGVRDQGPGGNEIVTINYDRLLDSQETKLSWCFYIAGIQVYLPKSQVEDIRETAKEFDIPRWLMEKRGLEEYAV